MVTLHLVALVQGHWLIVSLSPGRSILGPVPSLEVLF
jgi:hypothetical protein